MKKTKAIVLFMVCMLMITTNFVYCAIKTKFSLYQIVVSKDLKVVNLTLNAPGSNVKTMFLKDNRLIIDISDCTNRVAQRQFTFNQGCINEIRNAQYKQIPAITRVVIAFNMKVKYSINKVGNNISVNINETSALDNKKYTTPMSTSNNSVSKGVNIVKGSQQENESYKITYKNAGNSVIRIPNIGGLKYTLYSKILTFQLNSKYDYNNLLKIKDKFIKKIQIIKGSTFNTFMIMLNQTAPVAVKTSNGGVDLNIGKIISVPSKNQVKVLKPKTKLNRVVVIDPGHGGPEPGSKGNGILEKNLNLLIAQKVRAILLKNNINVFMTRNKDEYLNKNTRLVREELISRAQYANSVNADFLISIHTNASNPSAHGVETMFYPDNGEIKKTLKKGKVNSKQLACFIQNSVVSTTGAYNRRIVANPKLIILKYTNVVPCLIEVGFLSNAKEAQLLKNDKYTDKMAQGIANGIIKAYNNN